MRLKHIGVACLAVLACSEGTGSRSLGDGGSGALDAAVSDEQPLVAGPGERTTREVVYDTLWTYGGPDDTLLAAPIRMAAAPMGGVYVLDAGMTRVYHFADGRLVWSWGTVGQGPGEILSVRAMDADPETGGVVLVDSRNRRMILLSSDGSLLRETPIEASSPLIPTVAALGGGLGYVISTYTVAFPLMHVGKNGDSSRSIPAPWDGLVSKNAIQVMGSVFAISGGRWGYALTTGDRWFVYPSVHADAPRAHPYIEHVDYPEVVISETKTGNSVSRSTSFATTPVYSAYDLDVKGDTLFVLAGASAAREALDVYTIGDGQYMETRSLPGKFTRVALAGDTVFVIDQRGVSPVILSLHSTAR